MDGTNDVDEFEKYFQKASTQMTNVQLEEIESNIQRRGSLPESQKKSKKKSKNKHSSSIKLMESDLQPSSAYNEYLSVSSRQTRTSISNPSDAHTLLLRPTNQQTNQSLSASNSRSNLFTRRSSQSKLQQSEFLAVADTQHYRRASLTPEEQTENKLEEIKKVQKDGGLIVRSFLTSPKGLVNRGDSFKKQSDKRESLGVNTKQDGSKILPRRFSDVGKRASIPVATSATISDLINANVMSSSNDDEAISLEPRTSISCEPTAGRFSQRHQFVARPSIEITKCYLPDEPHTPEMMTDDSTKNTFSFSKTSC
ncbi:hypothetical protein HELRODRAFT_163984 [Helobdella robusta]|uniref:Uncharacterized protein n=1 Tax=Helobdella robusta TaxID=6412 RepID=T1EUQ2_HELRO|nr:hypothetical protein HELRODRAFT_163984 [Helobdella robusta]ESN94194.1 hypothetical protein HELRODRAFT_163984 [Helobdella robusta]